MEPSASFGDPYLKSQMEPHDPSPSIAPGSRPTWSSWDSLNMFQHCVGYGSKYLKTANWPIHPILHTWWNFFIASCRYRFHFRATASCHSLVNSARSSSKVGLTSLGHIEIHPELVNMSAKPFASLFFVAFLKTRTHTHYIYLSIHPSIYLYTYY